MNNQIAITNDKVKNKEAKELNLIFNAIVRLSRKNMVKEANELDH